MWQNSIKTFRMNEIKSICEMGDGCKREDSLGADMIWFMYS